MSAQAKRYLQHGFLIKIHWTTLYKNGKLLNQIPHFELQQYA
jgi:hypothetical protein